MKSDCERATLFIDSLPARDQVAFLARLIYELTLAGRTSYSIGASGLDCLRDLRVVNELQHRASAQIMKIATEDAKLCDMEWFVKLFLETDSNERLSKEIRRAFIDALAASVDREK